MQLCDDMRSIIELEDDSLPHKKKHLVMDMERVRVSGNYGNIRKGVILAESLPPLYLLLGVVCMCVYVYRKL